MQSVKVPHTFGCKLIFEKKNAWSKFATDSKQADLSMDCENMKDEVMSSQGGNKAYMDLGV